MTAPRPVVAGRTYLISRRCTQRQFLLRPDDHVAQVYLYCLGEAAERFAVTLHGWMSMSNHQHLVIRDNLGNFPEFLAHFHKMVAKALNAYWDRCENFWASEQANVVYLVGPQDRFDKLAYLLANPVADHLVEKVADWPGASSYALHLSGRTLTVKRPRGFFRDDGPLPDAVSLRAERLEGFEELRESEWREKVRNAVEDAETKANAQRRQQNLRVLGRKSVLRSSPTDRPDTVAPRGGLRPFIACRDYAGFSSALEWLGAFREAYREARLRWCAGDRSVMFPPGTYLMLKLGARRAGDDAHLSAAS